MRNDCITIQKMIGKQIMKDSSTIFIKPRIIFTHEIRDVCTHRILYPKINTWKVCDEAYQCIYSFYQAKFHSDIDIGGIYWVQQHPWSEFFIQVRQLWPDSFTNTRSCPHIDLSSDWLYRLTRPRAPAVLSECGSCGLRYLKYFFNTCRQN